MTDVKCATLGCPAYISDPCIKISGLFLTKMDLEAQVVPSRDKINAINNIF